MDATKKRSGEGFKRCLLALIKVDGAVKAMVERMARVKRLDQAFCRLQHKPARDHSTAATMILLETI